MQQTETTLRLIAIFNLIFGILICNYKNEVSEVFVGHGSKDLNFAVFLMPEFRNLQNFYQGGVAAL